jgi:hypothetical protein
MEGNVRDPLKTTVKGLDTAANVRPVIQRIQNKIINYGVCSEQELEFLQRHCDIGQIRQRDLFS